MPEKRIDQNEINRELAVSGARDLAMRNQNWVLWKFGYMQDDVEDGERPIGDRLGTVWGFDGAAESCRMLMVQDVTINFMKLVPSQPNERLKIGDVYVRRRMIVGSGRPQLDPDYGRAFPPPRPKETDT